MVIEYEREPPKWVVGLDLGQASDYSALAAIECRRERRPSNAESGAAMGKVTTVTESPVKRSSAALWHYRVRHLERFPLGTSYPDQCDRVVRLVESPPLAGCTLAVDHTGVGRAVVDMLVKARPRATIRPVTITAGSAVTEDGAGWRVAKKELVGVLQVLLSSRRIKVATDTADSRALQSELDTFRVKVTEAANETFASWREQDHDDLVLALAVGCWVAERGVRRFNLW